MKRRDPGSKKASMGLFSLKDLINLFLFSLFGRMVL